MKPAILAATLALTACAYQPSMPPPPITEGMDTATLTTYYGNPVRINRSSHGGEQWVFQQMCQVGRLFQDTLYVYVENGEVTAWQKFGCIY